LRRLFVALRQQDPSSQPWVPDLTGGKWLPECVSTLCHLECDFCLVRPECVYVVRSFRCHQCPPHRRQNDVTRFDHTDRRPRG
jgi:hypothetical protein